MPYIGFYSQGGGGGTPICNVGGAVNSTLSSSITGPYAQLSRGGIGVATNIMFGMSGQWGATYSNRTVTEWSVDLATGIETINGSSVSIPAGIYEPAGIDTYFGYYDSPVLVFRHQHPSPLGIGLGVLLPNGQAYLMILGNQWTGLGTPKFTYFDGVFHYIGNDTKIRRATLANFVLWDSGGTPSWEAESAATGASQSLAVDDNYVYNLQTGTTTIHVLDKTTLASVTTLTHPAGVNGGNYIYVDEYNTLWAVRSTGQWKHNGSNSWTQVSSSVGSAGIMSGSTLNIVYRHVLYAVDVNSTGGNYNLYKSIPPC